jgi:hypothetical protein
MKLHNANIEYDRWWVKFGLKMNPYVYGPMPWKRTSQKFRLAEARKMGWISWNWNDGMAEERFMGQY